MKHNLTIITITTILSLALILTACANPNPDPIPTPTPNPNTPQAQTLNVCIASEPESIDPSLNTTLDGGTMLHHMFEGLLKWVDNGSGSAVTAAGQALSWEITTQPDHRTVYTFHLRDNIYWHDGKPVTAQDFVYAWQRLVDPQTAAPYSYLLSMVENAQQCADGELDKSQLGVRAVNDQTLEVNLTYNCPYFLELCAFPVTFPLRQDVITAAGDQWTFSPNTMMSNGPYKMSAWEHNAFLELTPNDKYYNAAEISPTPIRFTLMDDQNAMLAAFRSGELDFIRDMPIDEIPQLISSGELVVADNIGTYFVCFQNNTAPFDNPKVRKAFSLAIDRTYLVDTVTRSGYTPATGYVPFGVYDADGAEGKDFRTVGGDFFSTSPDQYQANCDTARQLLAEAGYPDGQGFPQVEYLYNTSDAHKAIGEALQFMWKQELGVDVTLQNEEWATFVQTRRHGNFQMARHAWLADFNDPISFLDMWDSTSGNNDAKYNNPAYDALLEEVNTAADPAARMTAMHNAEQLLIDTDSVIAPLYFYTAHWLIKPNVQGMFYSPLGYNFFMYATKSAA